MSTSNALYTDLSCYYDLMCADIDYASQSQMVHRLHQLFGNGGNRHLDLACGTGPHIRQLLDLGYQSSGLDLNQPMLDKAKQRCPEASFVQGDMCALNWPEPLDLITCFLYSLHYCASLARLNQCIRQVHQQLATGGLFCFNAVDKQQIDNRLSQQHSTNTDNSLFHFESGWYYPGTGEQQQLQLAISRSTGDITEQWQDSHPMVAVSFSELHQLLEPYFETILLQHDYEKIVPLQPNSGNTLVLCIKKPG
ncbi:MULTISPECIES: class I SAM-dependent DNA methyltransferase [Rheinheimera]|uniref:Class I SAM-dependent DNA methyltransferase n=1 Tax=Rheinheimera marina TaxID=1774958 RepID=A0ABV9JKI4_9GAMM